MENLELKVTEVQGVPVIARIPGTSHAQIPYGSIIIGTICFVALVYSLKKAYNYIKTKWN